MADYNPILDAETDPEAGLRSSLFKRMVANPIAIAEGAVGAPRIRIGALQRLTAGDEIRSRSDSEFTGTSATDLHAFSFVQAGTIRMSAEFRNTNAIPTPTVNLNRTRNGTTTTVATLTGVSGATYATRTADVDVLPGDSLQFARPAIGTGTLSVRNMRFMTDGEDLWPGVGARLEGNTYNV